MRIVVWFEVIKIRGERTKWRVYFILLLPIYSVIVGPPDCVNYSSLSSIQSHLDMWFLMYVLGYKSYCVLFKYRHLCKISVWLKPAHVKHPHELLGGVKFGLGQVRRFHTKFQSPTENCRPPRTTLIKTLSLHSWSPLDYKSCIECTSPSTFIIQYTVYVHFLTEQLTGISLWKWNHQWSK